MRFGKILIHLHLLDLEPTPLEQVTELALGVDVSDGQPVCASQFCATRSDNRQNRPLPCVRMIHRTFHE